MDSNCKERKTLKSYFRKGSIPTEEQFGALIDSVPNTAEDGRVTSTADDGIRLYPAEGTEVAATLFSEDPDKQTAVPAWRLALDREGDLEIRTGDGTAALRIDRRGNVTVAGRLHAERYPADSGEAAAESESFEIKADGVWHDLPVEAAAGRHAAGCRVYRISACWLNRYGREYRTCEATASHSDGRRRKIGSPHRHWWGWSGRIAIRWRDTQGKLRLQMRSRGARDGTETIRCRIDTLWDL